MKKEPILISACLLGEPCRYDARSVPCEAAMALAQRFELVPVCPEQLGGLPTPRVPSEIQAAERGKKVVDRDGVDRTEAFLEGARKVVGQAREHGCAKAVLKSRSPSCGVHEVYDGTFSGILVAGEGVTAALLRAEGVAVFDEHDIESLKGIS